MGVEVGFMCKEHRWTTQVDCVLEQGADEDGRTYEGGSNRGRRNMHSLELHDLCTSPIG